MAHSREFLEEVLAEAKKVLPGYMYAYLRSKAQPKAGGRASHRIDDPTTLEKIALTEIKPATLRRLEDADLKSTWLRLNQWFANLGKRGRAVEDVVNAAMWARAEMRQRGIKTEESALTSAIDEIEKTQKDNGIAARLEKLPKDLVVVENFVSLVGSAAKGKDNPCDLDLLVRAPEGKGCVEVRTENMWLPIRNALDPDKQDILSFIFNAQGGNDDHVPLFDLVLRRRDELKKKIVKKEPSIDPIPDVSGQGPQFAPVAFIGATPSKIDKARKEPFTGPAGATLRSAYLEPLGLSRRDIFLANAIPVVLDHEPTSEEIEKHRSQLIKDLDEASPGIVIALGKKAKEALGDRADFVLPHPESVRRFDSGEVGRKIKAIGKAIKKQRRGPGEEGSEETGGERAQRNWDKNWHEIIGTKGSGRFVYQNHFRGLERTDEQDETRFDVGQLMGTDNSLHGDLRLEGQDELFGWAILIGSTEDNRKGDRFLTADPGKLNLRLAPKLGQPKAWLDVGVKSPLLIEPGGPGATSKAFAKIFAMDKGTYQLGVAQQHSIEIFLDGDKLKGRYLITFPQLERGRRVWLIDKPEDQTPRAERVDLADEISELRRKGRKFLIWGKPGEKPKLIDVRTGNVVKSAAVPITKADPVKRIVYGIVLDPYGTNGPEEDAHADWNSPAEIEKTAHDFMDGPRVIGFQHRRKADAKVVESSIEEYPSRGDYLKAIKNEPHKVFKRPFGDDVIHSGAWRLGVKLGPEEWKAFERGEVNAFSPGGFGIRRPLKRSQMPRVTFVELVPTVSRQR